VATWNPPLLTGGLRSGPRYYLGCFHTFRNTFLLSSARSRTDICFPHEMRRSFLGCWRVCSVSQIDP
jgi:hypothetical protein